MLSLSGVLTWLFAADLGRDKLASIVLCTVAIYVLATNLVWRLGPRQSWLWRSLAQFLRLSYYVGIPCTVLWRGALVAQMGIPTTFTGERAVDLAFNLLGLTQAHDLLHIGRGLFLGGVALGLLIAVWVWYTRVAPGVAAALSPISWWAALSEAVFLQIHWAFYRGFVATLSPDPTVVAFSSLALVAFSWLLDPRRRHALFTPRSYLVVQDWMCALLTLFLSLSVQILWLSIVLHALWLWIGGRVLARFASFAEPLASESPL